MVGERFSATPLMGGMPFIVESAEAVAPKKGGSLLQEWAREVLAARESGNERRFVNAQIVYGGLMMANCAEDSHELVVKPLDGQASILSSSVSVVEIGRELAELTALWARMETALWRERSALWNEEFPEHPIDLDDSPWYETQEAPALESARGGGVSKASVGDRESPDASFPPTRE